MQGTHNLQIVHGLPSVINAKNMGLSEYQGPQVDSIKWSYNTENVGSVTSPVIGVDSTIYVGSADNELYAINPDGSTNWSFDTGARISTAPAVGEDGTILYRELK